jgi:uncharacterized protein (DUF305 family)
MVKSPDTKYAEEMILHHQDAVNASRELLRTGSDPQMLFFAKGVVNAQEHEIEFLTKWLKARGSPLDSGPATNHRG